MTYKTEPHESNVIRSKIRFRTVIRISIEAYLNQFLQIGLSSLIFSMGYFLLMFLIKMITKSLYPERQDLILVYLSLVYFLLYYYSMIPTIINMIDHPDQNRDLLPKPPHSQLLFSSFTMISLMGGFFVAIGFHTMKLLGFCILLLVFLCDFFAFGTPFLMVDRNFPFLKALSTSSNVTHPFTQKLYFYYMFFCGFLALIIRIILQYDQNMYLTFKQLNLTTPLFIFICFSIITFLLIFQIYIYRLASSFYFDDMVSPEEMEGAGK